MIELKYKKADSRILSPWLFIILAFIGVIIVGGVFSFFSGSLDIRILEAKSLSDRLVFGISDNGYLRNNVLMDSFNIFENSKINEKMLDNNGVYYFNITLYDESGKLVKSIVKGNSDFEIQCRLKGNKLAKCFYREFKLYNDQEDKLYNVIILTGSNNGGKTGNNVK
jgi:hypothetical protein